MCYSETTDCSENHCNGLLCTHIRGLVFKEAMQSVKATRESVGFYT